MVNRKIITKRFHFLTPLLQLLFKVNFLFVITLFYSDLYSQQVTTLTTLESSLYESSGLLFLNQKLITHNDSQGASVLYEMDSLTGQKSRTVVVANATNIDWEDVANDDTYIYIGDFGNNAGNRTDLKIYRISQNDYWNASNDTVFADTIQFSYAQQVDFTAQPNATNWDCEAMTIIGDSIYLFSKNWINQKTYVYTLPILPGSYSLTIRDSLSVQGLITSADFNPLSSKLILTGNTPFYPFIVELDWDMTIPISQLTKQRYSISVNNSIQVESVAHISGNEYYLTSEFFSGNSADLMRLKINNGSLTIEETDKNRIQIFPNPSSSIVEVQCQDFLYFTIISTNGRELFTCQTKIANIDFLASGTYQILVYTEDQEIFRSALFKQ